MECLCHTYQNNPLSPLDPTKSHTATPRSEAYPPRYLFTRTGTSSRRTRINARLPSVRLSSALFFWKTFSSPSRTVLSVVLRALVTYFGRSFVKGWGVAILETYDHRLNRILWCIECWGRMGGVLAYQFVGYVLKFIAVPHPIRSKIFQKSV